MIKKVGVIVEWDNARLSDVDRAREMLRRLTAQAGEVAAQSGYTFELLLIYDPDEIPDEVPVTVAAECIDRARFPGDVRILPAPSLSYYDQKNFGVSQTDADVIVFIDSDVVTDQGWLKELLDAIEKHGAEVVGGETYLTTDTFYERLCAAFWNFDVNRGGEGMYETRNFYANNVALKRSVCERFPFEPAETFRGQCASLAKKLRTNGIKIYRVRSATVSHPPPEGAKHFIHRAICQGHDALLNDKIRKRSLLGSSPLGSLFRFGRSLINSPTRIWSRRRQAKLGAIGMVSAFALSAAYSGLMLLGELATFISPRLVRQYFSI
ncbi:MAG: glycosyltransferase family 2 protein [Alphaproteobacteria bacterium]|nr:glycosyltransferase family 2 protein [Alphaproteobacteria bacterium]